MALTLLSWTAVVNKKRAKSSEFKDLDTAVNTYLGNQASAQNLTTLKTRWKAWTDKLAKDKKTYATSDRYVKNGALDDLAALCAPAGPGNPVVRSSAVPLPPMPVVNKQDLAAAVMARENRVIQRKTANLVFTMRGPTNLDIDMALRYNFRNTGIGKQDAEILVSLPIKVHHGAASKAHWIAMRYPADLFDRTVHQGGQPGVIGGTASADVLKMWSKNINDWWGNAAVIHHPRGGKQSYYRLKFEFTFTDDAAKACKEVCCVKTTGQAALVNPNSTIDAVRWGENDAGPGGPVCHEVGHFLGCPDEYYTINYEGRTVDWGDPFLRDGVMNDPGKRPLARHYRKMGQELANHYGFDPNESSIILNVTLSLDNAQQRGHKLSGHIWD